MFLGCRFHSCPKLVGVAFDEPSQLGAIGDVGYLFLFEERMLNEAAQSHPITTYILPPCLFPQAAFYSDDSLAAVEIPATVTSIGVNVLDYTPSLRRLYLPGSTEMGNTMIVNLVESLCATDRTDQACVEASGSRAVTVAQVNSCGIKLCPLSGQ